MKKVLLERARNDVHLRRLAASPVSNKVMNGGVDVEASLDLPSSGSKKRVMKESSENDKSLDLIDDVKRLRFTKLSPKRGRMSDTFVVVSPTNNSLL